MKWLPHSIRLRLVDWLERIRDQVAKDGVEVLREPQVHAQTRADNRLQRSTLNPSAGESHMDLTPELAGVDQQIGASQDYLARFYDSPDIRAYLQNFAGTDNRADLIDQFNASQMQNMTSGEIMRLYGNSLKPAAGA